MCALWQLFKMGNVKKTVALAWALGAVFSVYAEAVVDDTPTRVQTALEIPFRCVGTLTPKSISEVSATRWTLDCAGMDREHADWRAVREYIAPLGIARIRVQAGWARCEKDPGVYDFAWLDQIVFDAHKRGIGVWMELSYGNPAYPGGGGRQLAAGIPSSGEGLLAWDRWVEKLARRYKGVVTDWCVWNEPDFGKNDVGAVVDFTIRTAEIVKREIPAAKIAAMALMYARVDYVEPFVVALKARGKTQLFDSIAYHHYALNPDDGYEQVEQCHQIVSRHAPNLRMWEGEGGTLSEWCAAGALSRHPWTELTQAKYDLRRSLGDLGHGDDTEVFHLCDLEYRTSGFHDGLLRYGLLKTTGQAAGYRVLKVKMSYYAIQNAVSVFNDRLDSLATRTTSRIEGLVRPAIYDWQVAGQGEKIVVFWEAASVPSDEMNAKEAVLVVGGVPFKDPVLVDLLTGNAFEIPVERTQAAGGVTKYHIYAYDAPMFVTGRRQLALSHSWEVREGLLKAK